MTIKPILFNTEMVRAILNGRKTCTRRICKDGNEYIVPDMGFYNAYKRTYAIHICADKGHTDKLSTVERSCPICPGDILYVRETWYYEHHMEDKTAGEPDLPSGRYSHRYIYKADNPDYPVDIGVGAHGWRPSIHMPKEAARIWLKVTDVRVERLQEITADGIRKEGLSSACVHAGDMEIALKEWELLWNSIIKKSDLDRYGWDANPYVWVIEFEQCEKPKGEN